MPRFVSKPAEATGVRDGLLEWAEKRARSVESIRRFVPPYADIARRLRAGEPVRVKGWQIRRWVPRVQRNDFCIIQPDGTVEVVDRDQY